VVSEQGISNTVKQSVFKSIFVSILMHGHKSWVMSERVLSQVQATEVGFLQRIHRVTFYDIVKSCEIKKN